MIRALAEFVGEVRREESKVRQTVCVVGTDRPCGRRCNALVRFVAVTAAAQRVAPIAFADSWKGEPSVYRSRGGKRC